LILKHGELNLNEVLTEILRSGKVGCVEKERAVSAEIPHDVGVFVNGIIRSHKPKISLEVGLAYGVSALFICDALTDVGATKHYLIDPNVWSGRALQVVSPSWR
jgi:predicted O-methyltransferase YrrM